MPSCPTCALLEGDPQAQLDQPRVVDLAADYAEVGVGQRRARIAEQRGVGRVERFGPELGFYSLPDGERLVYREVPTEQARAADVDEAGDIAKRELGRIA